MYAEKETMDGLGRAFIQDLHFGVLSHSSMQPTGSLASAILG